MNVDRAVLEGEEKIRAARTNAERREFLYDQLFRNVDSNRDVVDRLHTESEAREMFGRALASADNRLQLAILRAAVDRRWPSVVTAFTKVHGEHPISKTVDELWSLTTARSAV